VAPYVDSLSSGFSFWLDHSWRRKAVALSGIHEGQKVLDVCAVPGTFLSRKRSGRQAP
jgi:ubiquinone/menaquinone biosynthesis C-methylase UbiE